MIGLRFLSEKKRVVWLDTVEKPLGEFLTHPGLLTVGGTFLCNYPCLRLFFLAAATA